MIGAMDQLLDSLHSQKMQTFQLRNRLDDLAKEIHSKPTSSDFPCPLHKSDLQPTQCHKANTKYQPMEFALD